VASAERGTKALDGSNAVGQSEAGHDGFWRARWLWARRIEDKLDQPCHKTAAALQTNPPLCLPPMRRIGFVVTWQLLDPLHPGRDAAKAMSRSHQAPAPMELLIGAPRGPQQKPQAWVGDDVGCGEVRACHPDAAFGISFQLVNRLRSSKHLHEIPDLPPRTLPVGVQIRLDANP
jgi:hypothetical protein